MKYDSFTGGNLEQIRRKFNAHMKAFEQETGIKVDIGNIRYDSKQFTTKATFTIVSEGEDPELAGLKHIFGRECIYYGLQPEDYGKSFIHQGQTYKIIGIKPRSKKYPILTQRQDGSRVKFTQRIVASCLSK